MNDVSTATTLVLLFRIGTLDPNSELGSIEEQCRHIRSVLDDVPLGRQNRESQLGPLAAGQGNPVLDGYDCVIWTIDAMDALARANIISFERLKCTDGGKHPQEIPYQTSHSQDVPRKIPVLPKDPDLVPVLACCMSRIVPPPSPSSLSFFAYLGVISLVTTCSQVPMRAFVPGSEANSAQLSSSYGQSPCSGRSG